MIEAAGYEILSSEKILKLIFRFNKSADIAFNSKFDMLGYSCHNLVLNLGATFIIFILGFGATFVLYWVYKIIKRKEGTRVYKIVKFFHDRIVFCMLIRFMIEGYLELTIMTLINLYNQ